ncbi:uncharacterized protein LOC131944306 isoform X2 [Physella acuta]|uniref:uncharacterized protein LOC131944306 isoform X2 n=1 Tax=Physella acuta TaxID=109671 RepID=UPI0027DBBC91|nr:uncharacterized protein LOC131944306 isoform X2 [Physella acuta]
MSCTSTPEPASCDFTIVVDGTEFKSHQEFLSSTSAYFDALFRSNMKETKEGRVELQGMTKETFSVVLNFIHQRVHGLTADNIDDIWDAANRLDIAIYLKEIEQFIIDNLSFDNLWHFYFKAVDYNSNNVKDGSVMFMKKNYERIFKMKEFLILPFPIVLSCINSMELNIRSEDSVLESILTWVSHGKYKQGACMTRDRSEKKVSCKDDELQNREGHSHDVTTSVGQICDSGTVAEDGETDKLGINIRKHGQHDDFKNDVTKCSRTGDRASYLAKLMSSAKLTLATESYLRNLLKHSYIIECPDAYRGIQEALKYKCGVYPLESAILTPLRTGSGKRNALAFAEMDSGLHLYDFESSTFSKLNLESLKGRYRKIVSAVTLGSTIGFICERHLRNCPFANHKCRLATVLLLNENKTVTTLYELCGKHNSIFTLFRVYNKIICLKRNDRFAASRSRIVEPDLLNTVVINSDIHFIPFCVFENDILMFNHEDYFNDLTRDLPVHTYNIETKSVTTTEIPNVGGQTFRAFVIHKDKETFLLLPNGILLLIKRGSDNAVKFTEVVHLWTYLQWWLSGAVCYKNELTLFCTASQVPHWPILASVPGLFDKINVVELDEEIFTKNMVPVIAPVSWFG